MLRFQSGETSGKACGFGDAVFADEVQGGVWGERLVSCRCRLNPCLQSGNRDETGWFGQCLPNRCPQRRQRQCPSIWLKVSKLGKRVWWTRGWFPARRRARIAQSCNSRSKFEETVQMAGLALTLCARGFDVRRLWRRGEGWVRWRLFGPLVGVWSVAVAGVRGSHAGMRIWFN